MDRVLESYEDLGDRNLTVPGVGKPTGGRPQDFAPGRGEIAARDDAKKGDGCSANRSSAAPGRLP